MIDEKRTHIEYDGVQEKGPRPYLVVKSNLYNTLFMACPTTTKEPKHKWDEEISKSYLEYEFGNGSYIKMNLVTMFPLGLIEKGIVTPIDRHLNKSYRNIAIKLLKESFDD